MKGRRHFYELSDKEIAEMTERCIDAAVKYSDEIKMSGLSSGTHDIYEVIEQALSSEHKKAKLLSIPMPFLLSKKQANEHIKWIQKELARMEAKKKK